MLGTERPGHHHPCRCPNCSLRKCNLINFGVEMNGKKMKVQFLFEGLLVQYGSRTPMYSMSSMVRESSGKDCNFTEP